MAAAAAAAAISWPMIPAAISAPAVRPPRHRAARWRPAPATATWTTTFRSEFAVERDQGLRPWLARPPRPLPRQQGMCLGMAFRCQISREIQVSEKTGNSLKQLCNRASTVSAALTPVDVNDINVDVNAINIDG